MILFRHTVLPWVYRLGIGICLFLIGSKYFIIHEEIDGYFTDIDQLIMAVSGVEMSEGNFYEPYFYSQGYNTHLEGLLAVPFIYWGIHPYSSVKLATLLIACIPFFALVVEQVLIKQWFRALLITGLVAILPSDYYETTLLSRGFVTGIFMIWLMYGSWKYPRSGYIATFGAVVMGFLAFWVNPNSVIGTIPLGIYILKETVWDRRRLIWAGLGVLTVAGLFVMKHLFYLNHPWIIYFKQLTFSISWEHFIESIRHLDRYTIGVTPGGLSFPLFISFLILLILLLRIAGGHVQFTAYVGYIIGFILVFFGSLFLSKTGDCNNSLLYSCSRMYLPMPLFLSIGIVLFPFEGIKNILHTYIHTT